MPSKNDSSNLFLIFISLQLEAEYARLTPTLKEILEKEKRRNEKNSEINQGLGISQAFELGERSNSE